MLELPEQKMIEQITPIMPRVWTRFNSTSRIASERSRRLGRPLPAEGGTDAPRQRLPAPARINAVLFKEIVVQ